jgi:hypothetical protein
MVVIVWIVPVKFAALVFFEEFNGMNLDGLDRYDRLIGLIGREHRA